jgi:hypothetical protein
LLSAEKVLQQQIGAVVMFRVMKPAVISTPSGGTLGELTLAATGSVWTADIQQDLTKDWQVIFHLGRTARGVLTIARMELRPRGQGVPEGGVTMALVRAITIAPARRYVTNKASVETRQRASVKASRRGRPSLLTQDYRKLLKRFDRLVERGDPHPAKTLATALRANHSTVRTWIVRAMTLDGRRSARDSAQRQ